MSHAPQPSFESVLRALVEATGGARTGGEYYHRLVRTFAQTLGVHAALVSEIIPERPGSVRTRALWLGDAFVPEVVYALAGTPCEQVVGASACLFEDDTAARFPADEALTTWGIRGYAGAPLFAADGRALGLLAVLHTAPLAHPRLTKSLLRIFAARTAAEMEREHTERRARRATQRLGVVLQTNLVGLAITGEDGRWHEANPEFLRVMGLSRAELESFDWRRLTHPDDLAASRAAMSRLERGETDRFELVKRYIHADGSVIHARTAVRRVPDPVTGASLDVVSLQDITAQHDAEARIRHMAYYDDLTGLPNRTLFSERLDRALLHAQRTPERGFAVLFMDLDHFKDVNDSLGHPAGDALLAGVAQRLRASVRGADTVARLGGDEFAVLQTGLTSPEQAVVLAKKLIDVLHPPFQIDGYPVHGRASIGIATWARDDDATSTRLMEHADMALYQAKEHRGGYAFHTPRLDAQVRHRIELGDDLGAALETGAGLWVAFQPIVRLADRRPIALEALARWDHPTRGVVGPNRFVPIAESCGLIGQLSTFVLRQAGASMQRWRQVQPDLSVSVNVSASEFRAPGFIERVRATLRETGLPGKALILEITERVLARDLDEVATRMRDLSADGVRFAIDDFGTGFSSLLYLKRLPVMALKVAQEFVRDMLEDPVDAEIVRATISLAGALDLTLIAEGIETRAQEHALAALGCTLAQGFRYARPVAAGGIDDLLQSTDPLGSSGTLPRIRPKG